MDAMHAYRLQVEGGLRPGEIRSAGPIQLEIADGWIRLQADPSGLIGVIRFLHDRGLQLIALERDPRAVEEIDHEG